MSWNFPDIGSHVDKISTWNPSQSVTSEAFRYIDLSSVDKDKKIISLKDVPLINQIDAPSRARQLVKATDVLVATVRPNLNGVAVVPDELDGATASTGYCVLRTDNSTLDFRYLYHWVKTNSFVDDMMKKATGANYPAVSDKIIKESKIPLPPLAEQKRIAAILDKADSLRRKNQQATQLADQFLRAVFLELFGKLFCDKGYQLAYRKPISELTTYIDYRGKTPEKSEYGVPLITAKNVKKGYVSEDPREYIPESNYEAWMTRGHPLENDVLFTTEAPLGNVALLGKYEKVAVGQRLVSLRSKGELTQEYLLFCLLNPFVQNLIEQKSSGSTAKGIRTKELWQIELPIPDIKEQNKFSIAYRKAIVINRKNALANYSSDELFNALSQKAFAGEL